MIELAITQALADFDLDVALRSDCRALGLFGASGAGKTTLLNAIAGLLRPRGGRIVIDGRVLFDHALGIDLPARERRVGYVFQDGRLFPHLNVRANLLYGAQARNLPATGFTHVVDLLDLGNLLTRKPMNLSGGERQRVAIGRALFADPCVLLLDEPLTGLHRQAREQVLEHLGRLRGDLAISTVIVSHHVDEIAALADEVVVLEGGRVLAQQDLARFVSSHRPLAAGHRS